MEVQLQLYAEMIKAPQYLCSMRTDCNQNTNPNVGEPVATLKAIQKTTNRDTRKIIIGDSKQVIQAISKSNASTDWRTQNIIRDIQYMLYTSKNW